MTTTHAKPCCGPIGRAIRRARGPIIASGITYVAFAVLGIALATAGWPIAVHQRDSIVDGAQTSPTSQAYRHGDRLQAALLDLGANLGLAAIPTSITGLAVVGPFPIAAYRGWIGGIVSIDGAHHSRLSTPGGAAYYLVTLTSQLVGFVLTMGAGVHVGLSAWRARNNGQVRSILGVRVPIAVLKDAGWIYLAALPFFVFGSLWEYLA